MNELQQLFLLINQNARYSAPLQWDNSPCPVNGPMEKLDTDEWSCSIVAPHCTVAASQFPVLWSYQSRTQAHHDRTTVFLQKHQMETP